MDITFRTLGPWGAGKGANLQPSEVDDNFWNLAQAIIALENNPSLPNGISSITVSGTQMTIVLSDGTTLGPYTLPVLTFRWRDEWQPLTSYAVLDVFKVTDVGIFMVQIGHTSGATFDPTIADGSGNPMLLQLFGSVDASLSGLSDVLLTSLADQDFLRWVAADSRWENIALGGMAYQDPGAVAITGGAITGMPTPTHPADVATKAYVDAVPGGITTPDGSMMSNIAGSVAPAIPNTLSNYLDHVLGTSARGTLLFRGSSGWVALAPGTAGRFLQTAGVGADPVWAVGGSGVTEIDAGTGITVGGAPITSTGSVALAPIPDSNILANIIGSAAAPVPLTLSQFLDHAVSSARASIMFRSSGTWVALAPGSSGQYLKSQGSAADLVWDNPAGSGSVTSITAGTGLTTGGSPITGAGTISLALVANGTLLANTSGSSNYPVPTGLSVFIDAVFGSTRGSLLFRGSAQWGVLTPGTAGQVLQTNGAGADPSWGATGGGLAAIGAQQLLVNLTSGSAAPVGHTLSDALDYIMSSSRGTLLYRGATGWIGLAPGTAGQVLTTGGATADPQWTAAGLSAISDSQIIANITGASAVPSGNTLSAILDHIIGNTRGALVERGASGWSSIAPGRSNYYSLTANGSGADPSYQPIGGYKWHQVVSITTTAPIAGTMSLGSSGGTIGGTTFTCSANGPVTIDGKTLDGVGSNFGVGVRVLFKDQTNRAQNMIWVLTTIGVAGSSPSVFTLASDFDDNAYFGGGDIVAVGTGTQWADTIWMSQVGGGFTLGSSSINWIEVAGTNVVTTTGGAKYVVSAFVPGVMIASQRLLYHKVSKAITFPANFGSYVGHTSEGGGSANATGSTVINVDKAPAGTPNTFSNIGTITFGAGAVTPTFATSGGTTVNFAQGDVLRMVGPATPDGTFADFYATLVGYET